jgi:hypothetical protein
MLFVSQLAGRNQPAGNGHCHQLLHPAMAAATKLMLPEQCAATGNSGVNSRDGGGGIQRRHQSAARRHRRHHQQSRTCALRWPGTLRAAPSSLADGSSGRTSSGSGRSFSSSGHSQHLPIDRSGQEHSSPQ